MRKLLTWLHQVLRWLLNNWPLWAPAVVLFGIPVLLVIALPGTGEERIRFSGLVLELLGVCTVVYGLREKGRLFGKSWSQRLSRALSNFPRWPKPPRIDSMSASALGNATMQGRMSGWMNVPADASLERRVQALEYNLNTLQQEQQASVQELRTADASLRASIENENTQRIAAETEARKKLEGLGGDGIHIEEMGIVWLIFGTILATASQEIAALLNPS
jgi:hypothetical protein